MRREAVVNRSFPVYPVLARLACSRSDHYLDGVIVWFAVALWVVIVSWSLALMRAAGNAELQPAETAPPPPPAHLGTQRATVVLISQGLLLAAVVAAGVLLSRRAQWEPWAL